MHLTQRVIGWHPEVVPVLKYYHLKKFNEGQLDQRIQRWTVNCFETDWQSLICRMNECPSFVCRAIPRQGSWVQHMTWMENPPCLSSCFPLIPIWAISPFSLLLWLPIKLFRQNVTSFIGINLTQRSTRNPAREKQTWVWETDQVQRISKKSWNGILFWSSSSPRKIFVMLLNFDGVAFWDTNKLDFPTLTASESQKSW